MESTRIVYSRRCTTGHDPRESHRTDEVFSGPPGKLVPKESEGNGVGQRVKSAGGYGARGHATIDEAAEGVGLHQETVEEDLRAAWDHGADLSPGVCGFSSRGPGSITSRIFYAHERGEVLPEICFLQAHPTLSGHSGTPDRQRTSKNDRDAAVELPGVGESGEVHHGRPFHSGRSGPNHGRTLSNDGGGFGPLMTAFIRSANSSVYGRCANSHHRAAPG